MGNLSERPQRQELDPGSASKQRPKSMVSRAPLLPPPAVLLQPPAFSFRAKSSHTTAQGLEKSVNAESKDQDIKAKGHVPVFLSPAGSPERIEENGRRIPPAISLPGAKRAPPPVNRANKPSTPTTTGCSSLEPGRTPQAKEGNSPFSTPPSSDESPTKSSFRNLPITRLPDPSNLSPDSAPRSYFSTQHNRQLPADSRRASTAPSQRFNSPRREGRIGVSPERTLDLPEHRPQLPVRRILENAHTGPAQHFTTGRFPVHQGRKRISAQPPPRPSDETKSNRQVAEFLPPPRRNPVANGLSTAKAYPKISHSARIQPVHRVVSEPSTPGASTITDSRASSRQGFDSDGQDPEASNTPATSNAVFPSASQTNRRPPRSKVSVQQVYTDHDTKLFDICGRHVCYTGFHTKAWDLVTGRLILDMSMGERDLKVTALVFKPGATTEEEGQNVWLGTNYGEIQEVDLKSQGVTATKPNAHQRREIIKIYRYQNAIWSVDEDGKFHI